MARVVALIPDLLFGSRVQGMLTAAGHDVELIAGDSGLRERLGDREAARAEALIVDLTNDDLDGAGILESLSVAEALDGVGTLAFYSHVDKHVRERAERAGFQMVVPRSRMAREGGELISRLLDRP